MCFSSGEVNFEWTVWTNDVFFFYNFLFSPIRPVCDPHSSSQAGYLSQAAAAAGYTAAANAAARAYGAAAAAQPAVAYAAVPARYFYILLLLLFLFLFLLCLKSFSKTSFLFPQHLRNWPVSGPQHRSGTLGSLRSRQLDRASIRQQIGTKCLTLESKPVWSKLLNCVFFVS